MKRRVSWGNYRVRQYLQTTEEVSPEEGKYALIENEDILSAPLGSASPNLDPPLSQLIKDSAKQDEAYRRKSANSPSDMDISEIMSPPTKSVLKPERTGRELIEEFNQSLESPPIYMNCEEDTPESQKYPLPDPGVPALLIKCDNTPIQSFSQEPAPRFPNLLTPVKEEDGESMMICSSGDTLMTDNTFSYYKDNQRHATPYLAINKSESPISSKSESSSSVVSSIKPILRKIDEEKPKYEESIPQTTEKAILLPSKLDVNKLTPLKPISWKSNFVMNSSGRKTSRYDNSKEQRVIEFRERLEAAKKSLEAALYEKETLEELSRELLMILRDQDLRIDSAISGLISEERKKEKSVDMLINTETEKLTRDLLEINERYR